MTGNDETLRAFESHMRTAQLSPVTITDRIELLARVAAFLAPTLLVDAVPADLERWQQTIQHLARGSVDIYTRHVLALYRWLADSERIEKDPTRRMVRIRPRKGLPHPISEADLRLVLACAVGGLRTAYVLAAFAGLRAGEIARLRSEDLTLDSPQPTAFIQGKGGRERVVPLLPAVVDELRRLDLPRRSVVVRLQGGRPYTPEGLSSASTRFLASLGVKSTLHSCRHYFATQVVSTTRDVLLVRDLLGHASVATTQIYMASSLDGTQERLSGFSASAVGLLDNGPARPALRAVSDA